MESLDELTAKGGINSDDVAGLIHVGTIGSNSLLGQTGLELPRCALLTTRGFRDILEIGRQNRSEVYNINFRRPRPLIPRRCRIEVDERVDSEGRVLKEVKERDIREVMHVLQQDRTENLAVCFLNSYKSDANEKMTKRLLQSHGFSVHLSSEVDPEFREYERTSTTVVNALLSPVLSRYLEEVEKKLQKRSLFAPLLMLTSSGGLVRAEEVVRKPIIAIESGPAAGVTGAAQVARTLHLTNVISFDMGGTTAKAGTVVGGRISVASELEVGGRSNRGRTIKGSGYPVRCPCIDLAEVSAGGGTVIDVDEAGGVVVGPESAGADPGPACYDRGGARPTITDANLVLGRLNQSLLGGKLQLNQEAAADALAKVAGRRGESADELAAIAIEAVNTQMAKAIQIVTLERGLDPRGFSLVAFGGAGPMHAAEVADEVGIPTVVIPPHPGLFSALGMLMADKRYDEVEPFMRELGDRDESEIESRFRKMENRLRAKVRRIEGKLGKVSLSQRVDLRYSGQGYEITVDVHRPFRRRHVVSEFKRQHQKIYGFLHSGDVIEITALRLTATVGVSGISLGKLSQVTSSTSPRRRRVWFADHFTETTILERGELRSNSKLKGPAIIEEYDSTTVVPPNWHLDSVKSGCLVLRRNSK